MQIIRDIDSLRQAGATFRAAGERLALVPTMGALHAGHLALVAEGRRRAQRVAATIFVNPLQFNDPADLARYPRTEAADLEALRQAGCDLVWLPTPEQLYPAGFATSVSVSGIGERWEGAHRPGHFDGVATVVAKLFAAVRPDVALFGEKDWQQLGLVRRMARDLDFGIEIVGLPTVREADGLAMSSRNALLAPAERARAAALPAALGDAAARIGGGEGAQAVLDEAIEALVAKGFSEVDYLALVDGDTLEPLDQARENARLIVAARIGGVRLIDNVPVTLEQQVSG